MRTRYLFLAFCLFCATPLFAQNDFFDKYSEMEGITSVTVSKAMFDMVMPMLEGSDMDLGSLKGKIDQLQIVNCSDSTRADAMRRDVGRLVSKQHEELMKIREGGTRATIYAKQQGGRIAELLLVVGESKEFTAIRLLGNFTMDDVQDFTQKMKPGKGNQK